MTKADYKEAQRWERIGLRRNKVNDPILPVVTTAVNCTCFVSIAGDHTVVSCCERHGVAELILCDSIDYTSEEMAQMGYDAATHGVIFGQMSSQDWD